MEHEKEVTERGKVTTDATFTVRKKQEKRPIGGDS